MNIRLEVNGEERSAEVSPWKRLLDVLREDLQLTGAKDGCGEGVCGACSVLLDGEVVTSCLVAIGQCHGRSVVTVEGLATGVDPCPTCGPGLAVTRAYLGKDETRALLSGNVCRCGYEVR